MNALNRIFFQIFFFSTVINWIVLYLVQKENPIFNWSVMIPVFLMSLAVSALVARRLQPLSIKVKFNDRALFINDLIKSLHSVEYYLSGNLDHHYCFKRNQCFPPQIEIVHVRFEPDNEVLIHFPLSANKALTQAMQPYSLLRERDFLKETDQLMKET